MCLFQFWFPQGICLEVVLLGCMVVLFLVFKGISTLYSMVAMSIYIRTSFAKLFPFLHNFPAFIVCVFFYGGHSDHCEGIYQCSFDLLFSNSEQCWAFFMWLLAIHLSSLEEGLFRSFPTVWIVCFSGIELYDLLVYFRDQSFVSCFIYYCFVPFWGLPFHLVYSFPCCARVLKFN